MFLDPVELDLVRKWICEYPPDLKTSTWFSDVHVETPSQVAERVRRNPETFQFG